MKRISLEEEERGAEDVIRTPVRTNESTAMSLLHAIYRFDEFAKHPVLQTNRT